ncbi:MAG: NAD(P)/FAD-dependent oxidoreductase [Clostridia bacterium]|nr:NAD(P)/FAD-dependent oxidoreductase [Clostridia bacterium]
MAKILIIGGGVAGLSAGIYAQLLGHQAVVCEKHFVAGGNLCGWDRGEYHIDNCIHWLTGTNPVTKTYKMWEELGALGGIEIFEGESLFTCEYEGKRLSLYSDLDKMKNEMLAVSPEDRSEILSFIRAVAFLQGFCGIAGTNHNEKISPFRAVAAIPCLAKYYRLTTGTLSERFSHSLLRFFFRSFWGDDFSALALIFVCAHFCGANGGIPEGSSCAMAERMVDRFQSLGGELLVRKEAVRICHKDGKATAVSFADGSSVQADYFILTPDPASVFGKLVDLPMPRQLENFYTDSAFKRFSSYQCAFSCSLSELPFRGDIIFKIPEECRSFLCTDQLIVREFAHEKSFSPEGKNILQTLTFVFEEDAWNFILLRENDREAYHQKKKEIENMLLQLIENQFPQMKGTLKCLDMWTPATYRRFTGSEIGSFMSFALPSKALPLRVSNRISGLSNVILATQWQQSPGGLPIAAEVGKKAAETVDKEEHKRKRK